MSNAFPSISKCALDQVNIVTLDHWLKKHKARLAENPYVEYNSDDEELLEQDSDEEMHEFELMDSDKDI